MARDPNTFTITGRLTADPELRTARNGASVCNLRVASNSRIRDQQTGQWRDGDVNYWRLTAWRDLADHIACSLHKGDQVVVVAWPKPSVYERDGKTRRDVDWQVLDIGASLKRQTLTVSRVAASAGPAPAEAPAQDYGGGWSDDWPGADM